MQKNGFVIKICVLTDIKQKRGYNLPRCIIRWTKMKVLLSVNQFMIMLFCMLHFCILGQTEKMATSFLAVEIKRIICDKNNQ